MNTTRDQIGPELLALIRRQARSAGLPVDQYLLGLIRPDEAGLALRPDEADAFESDMIALAEGTEGLSPYTGTYSRDEIYSDHP